MLWLALLAAPSSAQTTRYVDVANCPGPGSGTQPDPFCSIQDAADVSTGSDLVLVAPGTYNEFIDVFANSSIVIRSVAGPQSTIVTAPTPDKSVVTFNTGGFTIDGFTITGGDATAGGGMITIHNNCFVNRCIFTGNQAFRGAGLFNNGAYPIITNSLFYNNSASNGGGGIYNDHGWVTLINCTVVNNTAGVNGGGIFLSSTPVVKNCLFWNNTDAGGLDESAQVHVAPSTNYTLRYSCIQFLSTLSGVGNIGLDPMFTDPASADFSLLQGSPCNDAGENAPMAGFTIDLDGGPRFVADAAAPDTGAGSPPLIDMGAHEFGNDCNGNGVDDAADIKMGTSDDCNTNEIPDDCEPDCNNNMTADSCDITGGISEDCANDGIPDECEADCNENLAADSCDILVGTSEDCNGNRTPDECDLASGNSPDADENDVPDECEQPVAVALGSRYISIVPALGEANLAIHISSPQYPCLDKYVSFTGAVVATPVFLPPGSWHEVYARGSEIVPNTTYEVRAEFSGGRRSTPAVVTTYHFGKVVNNTATTSFQDISAVVDVFRGIPGAYPYTRADLHPCSPNATVNFSDVAHDVDAFRGFSFFSYCPAPCQ